MRRASADTRGARAELAACPSTAFVQETRLQVLLKLRRFPSIKQQISHLRKYLFGRRVTPLLEGRIFTTPGVIICATFLV